MTKVIFSFFLFLLLLCFLLTAKVARKTPITQRKGPLATSPSHQPSLSPWFDERWQTGSHWSCTGSIFCRQHQLKEAFLLPCPSHPDHSGWHNYSWGGGSSQRKANQETDLGFVCLLSVLCFVLFFFSFAEPFLVHVNSLTQNSTNMTERVARGQTPALLWSSRTALKRWQQEWG